MAKIYIFIPKSTKVGGGSTGLGNIPKNIFLGTSLIMILIGTVERTTITFEKSPESSITFILLSTRLSSILCFSCALSAVKASLSLIILWW